MSTLKSNYPLWLQLKKYNRIPLKYVYLEDGAERHNKLTLSSTYDIPSAETLLIDSSLPLISNIVSSNSVNLVDLGCGNGLKTSKFVSFFQKKQNTINILLVDISERMLAIAKKNIINLTSQRRVSVAVVDFEKRDFKSEIADFSALIEHQNLFLLLGQTLGNPFEPKKMLQNIVTSMSSGDWLVIGVEVFDKINAEAIVSQYDTDVFRDAVFYALEQLGVKRSDGKIHVEFAHDNHEVLVWFDFSKPSTIKMEFGELNYSKGQRILLMVSHKFSRNSFHELIKESGLHHIRSFSDKDKRYSLHLCKKQRVAQLEKGEL